MFVVTIVTNQICYRYFSFVILTKVFLSVSCINASTNEDTDDMYTKALFGNNAEKKRKRKKPRYLSDTSDEDEVIKDNSDTDNCTTCSFILPPSHYQQQNLDKSIPPVNANATHVAIQESIDIMENNNMLEECNEINETEKKSSSRKLFYSDSTCEHEQENTGTATIITLQKQISTHSGKKTFVVKVHNVDRTIDNLPGPSKCCRTGNMTFANADLEINSNPVPARHAKDYLEKDDQVQESNHTRRTNADVEINVISARNTKNRPANNDQERNHTLSEPMTEERFLTYFKCLKNKLNHVINLLQDRGIEVENKGENFLPNFPLKTVPDFEQFEMNLVESSEIQKQYIREIKMIGGSDPGKFTRAIFLFLMSDELAVQYSWSGQKKTLQLKNTLISQLIVETVSKVKNACRSDIETFIKKWLQHASD
nr:PREDICTED: uncharacterized protein LOC105669643 [Linepithema humile]